MALILVKKPTIPAIEYKIMHACPDKFEMAGHFVIHCYCVEDTMYMCVHSYMHVHKLLSGAFLHAWSRNLLIT